MQRQGKRLGIAAAALALVSLLGTGMGPAQAASASGTIKNGLYPNWPGAGASYGGFNATGSATEQEFSRTGCSGPDENLQGFDAYVLDARPFAGRFVAVDWAAANDAGGRGYVNFYGQYCNYFNAYRTDVWTGSTRSNYVFVPAAARWMVVTAELKTDITFTVTG